MKSKRKKEGRVHAPADAAAVPSRTHATSRKNKKACLKPQDKESPLPYE